MTKLLLSVHVLASIVTIGPITVAASMFPRFVKPQTGDDPSGEERTPATAALLHRICRGYTVVGVVVPVFGIATGARMGVLGDAWLLVSIVLTAIAAGLLLMAILPGQERLLARPEAAGVGPGTGVDTDVDTATSEATRSAAARRLAMVTGIFNLLWAVVVVLMVVRPGSTTGA
ncbi:hypothetical protein HW130_09625 [Streptomyces sp. PKU-EA00015]|uniref:hypothetical protein n=1 Tax=Streptomyces sp. PKU-EA00015 TaxID=2748326 RepID=UPI0015A0BEC5|nr:hypothetical protein [Streptomyces sp. PKU-EA00015]NWF26529.1 hypothetical protein [Streptomyces sp. PKU-EA00015]